SMIQAVADDEERGALGMHYTSVPNILKVLNPLFLDDLREQLDAAGDNPRMLLNLRKRLSKIRVFDPACGSGNFLVIAYKQMREIENTINARRGELGRESDIPLTNFRGIELRDFSAEIARLALIIAEYQCNVLYRGPTLALADFLPLSSDNWITCGNALRLDWLSICPPTGTGVKFHADDLFSTPLDQVGIDFENEGGETYICGNPPYLGSVLQSNEQKSELEEIFGAHTKGWKSLDYVAGWFFKASEYGTFTDTGIAFVATNSICQGEQVPILWPLIFGLGHEISFAYRSFNWSNLASNNAGVTVVIVGLKKGIHGKRKLFDVDVDGSDIVRQTDNIGPYLVPGPNTVVEPTSQPISFISKMLRGNLPNDGGYLLLTKAEAETILSEWPGSSKFIRKFIGAKEFTNSTHRYCIWIENSEVSEAKLIKPILERIDAVKRTRSVGGKQARDHMDSPHRFVFAPHRQGMAIAVPAITSGNRDYLPVGLVTEDTIVGAKCYVMYDAPIWSMALIASRLHWVWIGTVCVRLRTDFSYSNTLGWNSFPVPRLTEKNKADLTLCVEDILLARENHFPATIVELYDPNNMPDDLRAAHERNDEVLERIYIGRRFRNDTERLEKLFELYTKMTTSTQQTKRRKKGQTNDNWK
ncbi:class I SAM-dependent DNA methyltransferase, partial [Paenibacillus sp. HGF5]|uniref:class I SAM-dependent DNA methyltransferase n=1 Tax=Paenibacillus sp. HGF5 TaxID=908341 RepID=UPI0002072066